MTSAELQLNLSRIMDQNYAGFVGFPDNYSDAARNWRNVFQSYYSTQITPIPGSANTMLTAGLQTFETTLLAQMQALNVQFESLITALHIQVIAGVTAAGLHATIPPPAPLNLAPCYLIGPNYQGLASTVVSSMATVIDAWVKTTVSTLILPPNTPVPWT